MMGEGTTKGRQWLPHAVKQITGAAAGRAYPLKMAWAPSPPRLGDSPRAGLAGAASNLKILAAGIPRDERGVVETAVRQALGSHAASEPWTVSLVKLGGKWSVTLNGPGERFRNLSFTAEETRLGPTIREILEADRPGATDGAQAKAEVQATTPAAEVREGHTCPACGQGVVVVYETHPGESRVPAPLACPHCWQISRVEVGAWAASGRDYRAEKA
jgi:hypothetical protein